MKDRLPATVSALVALREELQSLEPSLRLKWRIEQTMQIGGALRASRPWASPLRWAAVAATLVAILTTGWTLHRRAEVARSAQRLAGEVSSAWVADAEVLRVPATLGAPRLNPQVATSPTGQRYWIDLGVASDGSLHVVRVMPADDQGRPVY